MRAATCVAAAAVLIARAARSEPCGPETVKMTVDSLEDANRLSDALSCSGGGTFDVAWNGTVELSRSLVVGEGSVLNITGTRPATLRPSLRPAKNIVLS